MEMTPFGLTAADHGALLPMLAQLPRAWVPGGTGHMGRMAGRKGQWSLGFWRSRRLLVTRLKL